MNSRPSASLSLLCRWKKKQVAITCGERAGREGGNEREESMCVRVKVCVCWLRDRKGAEGRKIEEGEVEEGRFK